jgi:hypothetical protein
MYEHFGLSSNDFDELIAQNMNSMLSTLENLKKNSENTSIAFSPNNTELTLDELTEVIDEMRDDFDLEYLNENLVFDNLVEYDIDININQRPTFSQKLREIAIRGTLSTEIMHSMLNALREEGIEVPVCRRTLLHTPRLKIETFPVDPGEYFHFGFEVMLQKCNYSFLENIEEIVLDIATDGIAFYQSSLTNLWPILAAFSGRNYRFIQPFIIGAWYGRHAPKLGHEFLRKATDEISLLTRTGVLVTRKQIRKPFRIRNITCDTLGRALVSGTIGHTSVFSCHYCDFSHIKLDYYNYFPPYKGVARTNESFSNRMYLRHHLPFYKDHITAFEECGTDMIKQFPLDVMHLIDLGVMKKLLKFILSGECYGRSLNKDDILALSITLESYVECTPSEFTRNPRNLKDISQWKATEFRQFIHYTGIVLLKEKIDDNLYYHFLLLHCAYRLLSHPETCQSNVSSAQTLLEEFVTNFVPLYGAKKVSYNVHNLLHLSDCVKEHGCVDNFSAYKFENYLRELKKLIKKPSYVLQQLYNRIVEQAELNDEMNQINFVHPLTGTDPFPGCTSSFKGYDFDEFVIKNNKADGCCLVLDEIYFEISDFCENINDQVLIIGQRYNTVEFFFESPMSSLELGIALCSDLNPVLEKFPLSSITTKFFRLPYQNKNVLISLLHY